MPTVSRRYPVPPPVESLRYKVPVQSAAVGSIFDNLLHMAGWRWLTSAVHVWDYNKPSSGTLEGDPPNGSNYTVRCRFTRTGLADHIFLIVHYQAYELPSGTACSIVAHLDNITDGATSEDQIKWSVADGTLPDRRTGGAGSRLYPPLTVTSTTAIGASAPAPGAPSGPRMLNYAAGDGVADELSIRLVCTDVRPLGLYVIEGYQESL